VSDIPPEDRERIVKALEERGATRPCPRCGNSSFELVAGYFKHFIQESLSGVSIGGPSIPTVVVVCSRCGWLSEHAVGSLELLPKQPDEAKKEGEQ
jgi:ribosomal protein S27AE